MVVLAHVSFFVGREAVVSIASTSRRLKLALAPSVGRPPWLALLSLLLLHELVKLGLYHVEYPAIVQLLKEALAFQLAMVFLLER